MADTNNWLNSSLEALPGVLTGASNLVYASKGISNAPVTYVQAPVQAQSDNRIFIYIGLLLVAALALFIIFKR